MGCFIKEFAKITRCGVVFERDAMGCFMKEFAKITRCGVVFKRDAACA